ncbi:MAG: lipid II flippase MurJ, partial [Bartonella sp.]|nr:lipid II flippase MurJ [Bartonella sp.]
HKKFFIHNFFAREETKTPMIFAGICVFINISLALTLFSFLSARGIVIAEITAGWVNILLLCVTLLKRGYWKYDVQLIKRMTSLIIASFFMAFTLYYSISFFSAPLSSQASFFLRASSLAGLLIIATSVYFIICLLFGTNYLSFLRKNVKQHL